MRHTVKSIASFLGRVAAATGLAVAGPQNFQTPPTAHFSMTAQGQFGSDGNTLNVAGPVAGSVTVGLMSTTIQGSAPLVTYTWTANGMSLGCTGASCSASLGMPNNTIVLTVTDSNGRTSTAMGVVNLRAQSGPKARFSMTAQGQFAMDGATLNIPSAPPGGVNVSLSSTSMDSGSPIVSYAWTVNGMPLPCASSGCNTVISNPTNTVALTVTDSIGQSSTATATIRIGSQAAGPVAHFTMSGGGKSGADGEALTYVAAAGGVAMTFTSASRAGGAPIVTSVWRVNRSQVCGDSPTCRVTLDDASNLITLMVADSAGRTSTASAQVNVAIR